jgi:GTP:adenosylcobinamide-phosphate guanylyltransferase
MNAIVTAGGEIHQKEPLYKVTGGGYKAMVEIAGKPMIQWVLDAIGKSKYIKRVFVAGLPIVTGLDCAHPLTLIPDNGDMLNNIRAGANEILKTDPDATHAILITGDLPALRWEAIDWLVCQSQEMDKDLYYTVIEKNTMEEVFPKSRHTYVRLKDVEICGGDMHCFRLSVATEESPLWNRLVAWRKSPLRQASLLGYDTMFFLMLRQLTLEGAEATVCKRLGVEGKALLSPYAELGMDMDKPQHLEILREYFSRRNEKHAPRAH